MALPMEWIIDPLEHERYYDTAVQDLDARSARDVIVWCLVVVVMIMRWASCLFSFCHSMYFMLCSAAVCEI